MSALEDIQRQARHAYDGETKPGRIINDAVAAAYPLIEAKVREQIATEIEARRRDANHPREVLALNVAASIARGGPRG